MKGFLIISFLTALLLITGCTTSSSHNRGSLSDAMDKARDDHEGSREVDDDPDPWWESDNNEKNRPREEPDTGEYVSSEPYEGEIFFTLRYAGSLDGTPYFDRQNGMELALGLSDDTPVDVYPFVGIHGLGTDKSHDLYQSIGSGALLLNAGVDVRYYIFNNQTFFSPYLGGRIGAIYMTWSYENPLTDGYDTIASDALGGLSLGAIAGVDLIQTDFMRLGAFIMPTAYLFGGETTQGFENDYFEAQGMVRFGLEGGLGF
ncbi:MAG: hypothetical protein PQJ59_06865 [Spirochaetales bacterium]|nr:hypothetical protein [Spirochaetales bacterium]